MTRHSIPLEHWGLTHWPFAGAPDAAQFYPTAGHNEALARIEYLIESKRRLGALVGTAGVGKSLLLREAGRQLSRAGRAVALVDVLGHSVRELLWQIAVQLGTTPREDADVPRLWRQIADRVAENRLQQVNTVLLADDAGQAGPDVITQLIRLARLDLSPSPRWTLVLAAEPAQAARWGETLRDLVDLRIDMPPWEEADTIGFVQTALVEAGSTAPIFESEALAALHAHSGGIPRRVTRLADFALLAGAAAAVERIDAALVQAAADEAAWPAVAGAN
jgi:general secretion pathway protein A